MQTSKILGRGLAFVALGALALACTQSVDPAESTGSTFEAIVKHETHTMMCFDCFEETSGGGVGSAAGLGSNGFVGGVVGWANGATSTRIAAHGGCNPFENADTECVEVHGKKPESDSDIRIIIVGTKERQIEVFVPESKGPPSRIDPIKARIWKCPAKGLPCTWLCTEIGAGCPPTQVHPQITGLLIGQLSGCKSNPFPNIFSTCTYDYTNGDKCTQVLPIGPFLCDKAMPH